MPETGRTGDGGNRAQRPPGIGERERSGPGPLPEPATAPIRPRGPRRALSPGAAWRAAALRFRAVRSRPRGSLSPPPERPPQPPASYRINHCGDPGPNSRRWAVSVSAPPLGAILPPAAALPAADQKRYKEPRAADAGGGPARAPPGPTFPACCAEPRAPRAAMGTAGLSRR